MQSRPPFNHNMALNTTEMSSDLGRIISDASATFEYAGQSVSCTAPHTMITDDVSEAGPYRETSCEVRVRASELSSLPTARDVVKVDGVQYYVLQVERALSDVRLVLRRAEGLTR